MGSSTARHRRHRSHARRPYSPLALGAAKAAGALLSLTLFAAFAYGWYSFRELNSGTHHIAVAGLGETDASGQPHHSGTAQNILVVGIDSRAGLTDAQKRQYHVGVDDQSTSTDTIMLVHVPADGRSATMISIPRDTYVSIPGHPSAKINAAYADGYYYSGAHGEKAQQGAGASLLVATVHKLTGVPIDHYVQVGFAGFVDIVKAIGNIPINLCESVDDTPRHNAETNVGGGSGFKMSAGHHDLTPIQTLEFVRQRHNIPGPVTDDYGRELRQRYFLTAASNQILSAGVLLNPVRLQHLIKAVHNAFTFDGSGFDLVQFAEQMSGLSASHIAGRSIPTTGSHNYGGLVGDAITVNPAAVAAKVQQLFGMLPGGTSTASGSSSTRSSTHPPSTHPGGSSLTSSAKRSCVY